jgi:DinB superfamily
MLPVCCIGEGHYNDSMLFQMDDAVRVLRSTPRVFDALFGDLPRKWLDARDAPEAFSAVDVLGHLIYGEQTDWIPRARIILECGETRPFDPFERRGFSSLIEERSSRDLLDMFAELREQNISALASLRIGPDELALTGMHPGLGQVTMQNLLAAWAVHDLGHTSQVARALASQYRGEVGPWVAYMSILDAPKT